MAPPAGTSSMLRSRRRDATLKPNRTLDRSASRGMLYENEELRLRTININAEVEKGQNYIKKLRRENEQLKREIWNLREEYERLENYVKNQEPSENEEENELDGDGNDDDDDGTTATAGIESATVLETVVEEEDDNGFLMHRSTDGSVNVGAAPQSSLLPLGSAVVPGVDVSDVTSGGNDDIIDSISNSDVATTDPQRDVVVVVVDTDVIPEGRVHADPLATEMTADVLMTNVGSGCPGQYRQGDLLTVDHTAGGDSADPPNAEQPHTDIAVLKPHTACFDVGNNRQLHDLTVDEVIDAIRVNELGDKLRSVCLTDDRCYMTFANAECLERALHTASFRIRDVPVLLMDTGAGAVILSLAGVPDAVADKDVLKCLKKYGTIIGGVERKTARGGGTAGNERYVRVRPTLGAPRYLWFGSDKVIVRQLTEHETGTMNSIARRKSFRSQIKLNLKMMAAADPSPTTPPPTTANRAEPKDGDAGRREVGTTATPSSTMTTVSVQNGFRFPTDSKTATAVPVLDPAKTPAAAAAATANSKLTGSPKRSTKTAAAATPNDRDATATSSVLAESPLRGRRRGSLMGFRRETVKHRGGSVSRAEYGGEDADSDTSTICRRKLSVTGREDTEKVPWCGCWGNGCL